MAYSQLPSKSSGCIFSLTIYDQIKDNFEASVPDVYTTIGDISVASAADTTSRLAKSASEGGFLITDTSACTLDIGWHPAPGCRLTRTSTLDPATSTWVALSWDDESSPNYDLNAMHAAGGANIVVPTGGAGVYMFGGNVTYDTSALSTGEETYGLRIYHNNTTTIAQTLITYAHNSLDVDMQVTTVYKMAAADYVTLYVYTSQDVNVIVNAEYSPVFWAQWLRGEN